MDPSKLAIAFQHMGKDEALQSSLSPTVVPSSREGTFNDLPSVTRRLTMLDPIPFVVNEALAKTYYKGLPSKPRLIATTNPGPFKGPTGCVLKELRELGDHPLASAWD